MEGSVKKPYVLIPLLILVGLACTCPITLPNTTESQSIPTQDNLEPTAASFDATTVVFDIATATQSRPGPTFTAPPLPFYEDFTQLSRDWWLGEDEYGEVFLSNGELHIINYTKAEFVEYTFPGINVGNVTLDVESYLAGGTDDNWISISCRLNPETFDEYNVAYSSDGYYAAYAFIDDERDYFAEATASSVIRQGIGEKNHMRLECAGDRIRFWINDVLLVDVRDDRLLTGDITLAVDALGEEFSDVVFDNLSVSAP